jgi:rhamnosyltransferase subunit B
VNTVGPPVSRTAPRASPSGRRIVLTTVGSLGDLHPYVAIALGLQARGREAILATGACYRRKIEALGIGFRAVRPDCD